MASRGQKKGKIVENQPIEDNENMARRKGGRTKKVIDYCESSPLPQARNNKGTEKTVISTKLEKGVKQNTKTKTKPVNKKLKLETVDDKDQKDELTSVVSKSNAPSKSKGKKKDGKDHVENKFEVSIIKDEQHTPERKVEKRSLEMSSRELTTPRGGKENKQSSAHEDRERKHELVKETDNQENDRAFTKMVKDEENGITELNTSGVTKNTKHRKEKGIALSKKQTKDSSRQPLSKRHDNVPIEVPNSRKNKILKGKNTESETVLIHKETEDIGEQCEESMHKHYTETECKQEKHSADSGRIKECPSKQTGHSEDTEECPRKRTENSESIDECDSKQMGNNTFTIDSTPETLVTTKDRRTSRPTVRQNTPSSEIRVQQVKENLRNSLCGNTPTNSGQADYSYQMSQVFEVLELVTEQLKDLKAEMETTKSTNESMKTELESTQTDSKRLREEMNILKNTVQQITTNTAQLQEASKSSTNQGEIDMLWEQCDTQKKMIRTLHDEMDNTRNDFNKKLEKYKKAMIFIMCKTKPDIRQSDVSNLRCLLSKTEQSLNFTLDEICSSMEADINMSTPSRRKPVVPKALHPVIPIDTSRRKPVVPKASHPVIPIEDTSRKGKIDRVLVHNEYLSISVSVDSTPTKGHNTLDPFRPRTTIKRTPVSKSSK